MALSPMMQQYHDAKQAAGDALLLFRMGDFYELFHEDAKTAARELGLSLTSRDKGENPIPMAGFPHHQLDQYLAKLIARGFRAAVCEQMEDPRQAKGIVKREVTRVVSRGTVLDDSLLEPCTANFLLALAASPTKDACGLAWIDVSTRPGKSLEPWYGYLWHVDLKARFEDDRLPSDGYLALGVFGQHIVIVPSADLVIVRVAEDALEPADFTSGEMIYRVLQAVL